MLECAAGAKDIHPRRVAELREARGNLVVPVNVELGTHVRHGKALAALTALERLAQVTAHHRRVTARKDALGSVAVAHRLECGETLIQLFFAERMLIRRHRGTASAE